MKKRGRRGKPFVVKNGSITVKIYTTPSHGCQSFTLAYWQDGFRKRPTFPTFEKAKSEAELVVNRLGTAQGDVLTLTSADRSAYLRAKEILDVLQRVDGFLMLLKSWAMKRADFVKGHCFRWTIALVVSPRRN